MGADYYHLQKIIKYLDLMNFVVSRKVNIFYFYTFIMAVVKLRDKNKLDRLIAKLILRLGRKVSQQDVIDTCIDIASDHMVELEERFTEKLPLNQNQLNEILGMAENFEYSTKGSIDEDIYGA